MRFYVAMAILAAFVVLGFGVKKSDRDEKPQTGTEAHIGGAVDPGG